MPCRLALLVAVLALALAACGSSNRSTAPKPSSTPAADNSPPGDIPDNQVFVTYAPANAGFTVKVPEGWSRTGTANDARFTDNLNSIEVAWNTTTPAAPTSAEVSTVSRKGGSAQRATYLAKSAADAVTGKQRVNAVERYEFRHGGKTVVLTLSGPKGADNVDPWRIVTDSLRWR